MSLLGEIRQILFKDPSVNVSQEIKQSEFQILTHFRQYTKPLLEIPEDMPLIAFHWFKSIRFVQNFHKSV